MPTNPIVEVGRGAGAVRFGADLPIAIIAGPCQLESRAHALEMASALRAISTKLGFGLVFKTSFDKANRTSGDAYRGPGLREALGGDDELVPLAPQPAAQDFLGDAAGAQVPAQGVGIRGIDEVDSALSGPVEDGGGGALIGLQSEGHRPQAEPGDLQAGPAESGVVHGGTLSPRPGPRPPRARSRHPG